MTSAAEPVVLATKLYPPVPRGLVSRPRLLARLRPAERKLTVLDAPAGWGKTSLLADWHATGAAVPVAWLALDHGDNDPVLFWSYVIAALGTQEPGIGGRAPAALRAGGRALREAVLPLLVNDLTALPHPLVLVLDDYQAITDPGVHATVAQLLAHLPPRLHLVVATRGDPPRCPWAGCGQPVSSPSCVPTTWRSPTRRSTGCSTRFRASGWRGPEVRALARRTEGWPAGLALAAMSLAGRGGGEQAAAFVADFTGTDRYVLDYLCSEVLASQPPELCEFLLRTSILPRLSPALCEAVTGRADAAAVLDRIERAGVFLVALDSGRQWYCYHRLFGELLRHQLAPTEPAVVPALHRRAAHWSLAEGGVGDAVEHLVAAGDTAAAGDLVAEHWNRYFNGGRLATVAGWLDRLPPTGVRADPRLCAARAWLLLDLGRLDDVDRWLAGDAAALPTDVATLRDMAVLRSVHRFKIGDVTAGRAAARRVLELDDGATSFSATVAHLLLGVTAFWHGEHATAARRLTDAVRPARRMDNTLGETYALGYLALAAVERGALDEAAAVLPRALERAADASIAEHFVAALPHLAPAGLHAASGRPDAAADAADRGLELARRGAGRLELGLALALRAHALLTGAADPEPALAEARALVKGCRDPGWLPERLARVGRALGAREPARRPATSAGNGLSDRERELLPLLAGTLSQREIGAVLHLSLNTVKTHSRVLFRKLGVSSRGEAVARARELGLLQPALTEDAGPSSPSSSPPAPA